MLKERWPEKYKSVRIQKSKTLILAAKRICVRSDPHLVSHSFSYIGAPLSPHFRSVRSNGLIVARLNGRADQSLFGPI